MAKTKEEMSQAELIMEYYKKHPKREIPHPEIVDCVVALITVEKDDDIEKTSSGLSEEVAKMCQEVGHKNVVILPFAHLSNNLAKAKDGIKIVSLIEDKLKKEFNVMGAHFGSHKELLLDIYGHPGNARYREF